MRWVICAAFVVALAPSAFAQDADVLRGSQSVGPQTFTRWSGFYAGGHFDYSQGSADFHKATQPLLAYSLRELTLESQNSVSTWPVLNSGRGNASGFGGFVGYNTQWQDLVLGVEANYTHSPFTVTATSAPLSRIVAAGSDLDSVNVNGTGTLRITDYGSLRARAGYVIDNFMPYGFAGFAMGHGSYAVTAQVSGQQSAAIPPATSPVLPCDPVANPAYCTDYSFANSAGSNNAVLYGFSFGGGFDMAVTQNVFVRAEYEFVQFTPIANITATISSVRVGAGLKF